MGLLAYRTYTGEAPIPGRVVDPDNNVLFTRQDVLNGQQIFLKSGLMEYALSSVTERIWGLTTQPITSLILFVLSGCIAGAELLRHAHGLEA